MNSKFSSLELEKMTNALSHRGPESEGYFRDEIVGLGHRRLRIIDLSDNGSQPMYSQNEKYVIVYNGEVYNFQKIADELRMKNKSLSFRSTSDTEVILEAFSFWGDKFVHKLNGMFAIAIYDKIGKQLFLYRDRIGIKPLYYYWDGDNFVFASEINSFKSISSIEKKVCSEAISVFLHIGYIPAPLTIYESIKKVEPGSCIKVAKGSLDIEKYWKLEDAFRQSSINNEDKAEEQLKNALENSVKSQLISDVPYGVFLSGGIDSSLIAALAAQLSLSVINTFSIGFNESKFNESIHAKRVADYLKTNHHEFIVSYKEAIRVLSEEMFETYGEPFADSSAIPTMMVSKLAKQNVTVVLSGDGADELFLGYGSYRWAKRLDNPFLKMFGSPLSTILRSKYPKASRLLGYDGNCNVRSHIFSQEQQFFSISETDKLTRLEQKNPFIFEMNSFLGGRLNAMEQQAVFDINYYLPDDLLTKIDRAGMHYSLETRVPYLDNEVINIALNLPPWLKYKNGETKYLLKKILYKYVPKHYFDRPKQGFSLPLQQWLDNDLNFLIEDFLSKKIVEEYNLVNYDSVQKLKTEYANGNKHLYNKLWLLIVLHKWMTLNIS